MARSKTVTGRRCKPWKSGFGFDSAGSAVGGHEKLPVGGHESAQTC